jgi:sn-glycerol 3-phosphate transport system substrate-binding protein
MRSSRGLVVLAAAVALLATACGGSGESAKGGAAEGSLPACPTGAIAKAAKPVHIVMWHSMTRANEDELNRLVERFNRGQHDVQVSLVNQTSYEDTFAKYRAGLTTGDLPDLVQLEDTTTQSMADTRSALPVQSCIDAEHMDLSDYLPRVLDRWSLNGVRLAMPFNVSNPVFLYNRTAFRKAGLDPSAPPATLDEVRADAVKLKAAGYPTPYGLKIQSWFLEQWLGKENQLYANNGNGRNERATKVVFENATSRSVFNWLSGMVRDKLAVTNPERGPSQFDNLLAIGNGNVAMTIDTSATLGTIYQVLNGGEFKGVDVGVSPMPGPSANEQGGVLVGGAALYISKRSSPAKQEAAWVFAKFLTQPDVQAEWSAATGYIPIRKSATTLPAIQRQWATNPGYKVAYDQLVNGPSTLATQGPALGDYQGVRDAVLNAETGMLSQGTPPDQALNEAADGANRALASYNARVR